MDDLSDRGEADRLQPALLDRLTDDEPGQASEAAHRAVMTKSQLKRTVLRDLVWLLNTTAHHTSDQLTQYPEVRKSVVNFGVPVLSGKNFSGVDWHDLEHQLREAIVTFEPRILPDSLTVKALAPSDRLGHHNLLRFEVHGELWSVPYPIELLLRSEMDLETGHISLSDQFSSGHV